MCDVGCGPNTEHRTPNAEHRTPNTEHRTPNTEHRTPNTEHRTPLPLPLPTQQQQQPPQQQADAYRFPVQLFPPPSMYENAVEAASFENMLPAVTRLPVMLEFRNVIA